MSREEKARQVRSAILKIVKDEKTLSANVSPERFGDVPRPGISDYFLLFAVVGCKRPHDVFASRSHGSRSEWM